MVSESRQVSENETLNFTRFNIIENLQKVVTSFSKLIQVLNKELFAIGDHLMLISVECVGCLYSASHSSSLDRQVHMLVP